MADPLMIFLHDPSPVLTGEWGAWLRPPDAALAAPHGPAAKRWEVRVCTRSRKRPSAPKPLAWVPPLPRKAGEEPLT
jgi:hypothetical protein